MIWQWALAAQKTKHVLGCIQNTMASSTSEGILPICPALLRHHLQGCISCPSQHREDRGLMDQVQRRVTKMIRGMEHLSCQGRLRKLGLFSLEKGKLWFDLIVAFQYQREAYKKDGEGHFSGPYSDGTKGNVFRLEKNRFQLYVNNFFFFFFLP